MENVAEKEGPKTKEATLLATGRWVDIRALEGEPLCEILSLCIDTKGENDFRGKLIVFTGLERRCVEFHFPGDSCSKPAKKKLKVEDPAGWEARLTGPDGPITAHDFFRIEMAVENDGIVPPPKESYPYFLWSCFIHDSSYGPYDEPREAQFPSPYGKVTMKYVVIMEAAEAYVEIFVRSEIARANIHGKIIARHSLGEIVIFEKGAWEGIEVSPGAPLPLSRRLVAVPMDSDLVIDADIQEKNVHIVQGCTGGCRPILDDTTTASIEGPRGEIKVKITFTSSLWDEHPHLHYQILVNLTVFLWHKFEVKILCGGSWILNVQKYSGHRSGNV